MTRIAIYGRVSTHKEDQEHGLVSQVRAGRKFLEDLKAEGKLEVEDVLVYEEQASGRKGEDERKRLQELLHDAAMKKFRALVVFRLDRLSRRQLLVTGDVVDLIKRLQGYGVRTYSVSEAWWDPDSPVAPLILAALSWAASMESRAIADRVSAGIAAKKAEAAEKGERFLWGRGRTSRLLEDPQLPSKVAALRREGRSWTQIAATLRLPVGTCRRYARYESGVTRPCLLAPSEYDGGPREDGGADGGSST